MFNQKIVTYAVVIYLSRGIILCRLGAMQRFLDNPEALPITWQVYGNTGLVITVFLLSAKAVRAPSC